MIPSLYLKLSIVDMKNTEALTINNEVLIVREYNTWEELYYLSLELKNRQNSTDILNHKYSIGILVYLNLSNIIISIHLY